ncbi:hypothetical protein SEA_LILYPAD_45 [Gordonia phage LilyPad]|nr:hypothetical protein SEA_LILYPAD_45 [Gordonia phage LilyPad]
MTFVNVEMQVELTPGFLDGVLVTAFDGDLGGSNYWLYDVDVFYNNINAPGSSRLWEAVEVKYLDSGSQVADEEDDELHEFTLDAESMAKGYALVLARKTEDGSPSRRSAHFLEALVTNDAGMIDADDADLIVQYAVFGKAVFG